MNSTTYELVPDEGEYKLTVDEMYCERCEEVVKIDESVVFSRRQDCDLVVCDGCAEHYRHEPGFMENI